ncbi:DNA polymerase IV [Leucobacter aridicollis]|uniref:DNA polymerase IV n=1 Tax=Leucobacter aridicollis TaxID=283878 RepID=A0A852QXN3_9MICO|nr:DNA polymerase IV [Leucobacter aridicollis]MBL3681817.1 DNA polymerase IV [Leucobacter aridicollis]NYD27143.1 DNA polymerase-4 [Leucobacter aridicollis]
MSAALRETASILHVDMDAFFVSVELLDRPELRGLPVAAAHDTSRSVVSSASYEARKFGVRSAMPIARARQLCPQIVFVTPVFEKYRVASRAVMGIFREFTPLVEPLSIDEAFLDVAGSVGLFGQPIEIARQIKERVFQETRLPLSVGLAGTKFVAKLASQRAKPEGILEIPPARTLEFLQPLPIKAMWGVGAATERALKTRAIHTVGDLAREPLASLRQIVGNASAERLHDLANGRDARDVETTRVEKSIGHEETFAVDVADTGELERELLRLSTRTSERLRDAGLEARTIAIKVRWDTFETVTRSRTLQEPTNATQRVYRTARELFAALAPGGRPPRPVRLIGVRAEQLIPAGSEGQALWDDDEQWRALDSAVDEVRGKFGAAGLTSARLLGGRGDVVDHRSLQDPG